MATTPHSRQTKKARIPVKKQAGPAVSAREPGEHSASAQDEARDRIERRAYELYVERGCRQGCALEDWLDAEREMAQPRAFGLSCRVAPGHVPPGGKQRREPFMQLVGQLKGGVFDKAAQSPRRSERRQGP